MPEFWKRAEAKVKSAAFASFAGWRAKHTAVPPVSIGPKP